jgi:asparagine synthase (glutamine-hydrolysing)
MLSSYPGLTDVATAPFAAGGIAGSSPGGIADHPAGLLLLDGLLYGDDVRSDDARILGERIATVGLETALSQANGDFAVAWLERSTGTLWLALDPFGMRPLYYASLGPNAWAASSQPRGLLRLDSISNRPDTGYLVRYGSMHYRMIDNEPESSPYAEIRQVPAASIVGLHRDGTTSVSRYWSLIDAPDFSTSEEELAAEYRDLLLDSVRLRVNRFPNRAFTLSGGMDSSSVLASAVRSEGSKQVAFSTLYEDSTYDERDEIADMLPDNVSDWRRVIVPNDLDIVASVDALIALHDEPVATATWLSHMLLCQDASAAGFASLFGGLGGDELNAGEYEYFPLHFADLRAAGRQDELEAEVRAWVTHHDHPVFQKTPAIAEDLMDRLSDPAVPGLVRPDKARMGRYLHVLSPDLRSYQDFEPVMDTVFTSCLKNRTWQDLSRETLPCCIRAEDRHGAAYGLPPVLPFLDRRLVEFMYRIPGSMKIRDGVTKRLLREATVGLLPEATRTRIKKTGWNAPAHVWFVGPGADVLRDMVRSQEFASLGIYDAASVLAIIDDHERIVTSGAQEDNHMMFLWPFLNLMRWQASLSAR